MILIKIILIKESVVLILHYSAKVEKRIVVLQSTGM